MSGVAPANFLVCSAGRRGELVSILRDVVRMSESGGAVFTVDASPLTSAGWVSDGLDLVPRIGEPDYLDALLEVCARRHVTHVVPTIDTELAVLADNRARFEEVGSTVWVSDPETIAIAGDKRTTNHWMRAHGFPTVEQLDLDGLAPGWVPTTPLVAKPPGGSSSIGLRRISTREELDALEPGLGYVLETVAPGDEYTVDVLVDRSGKCQAAVPRRRLETRAGEVSKGRTVRDRDLVELATSIADQLPGAYGVLNIQIFKDEHRRMNVIEVNARFGGGFPLTWAAGCQMPLWLVEESMGGPFRASLEWLSDQVMLRYDSGVYLDCRP